MAVYTKLDASVPVLNLDFTAISASSATSVTLGLSDGTTLVLTGTGFVVTSGALTAGTITSMAHKNASQVNVETLTGLSFSAVTFQAFVTADDAAGAMAALLAGGDTLTGGPGDDALAGYGGNDTIRGGDGADQINGGSGDDTIFGGVGIDIFDGGDGSDYLGADATNLQGIVAVFTGISSGTVVDVYGNTENFTSIEQIGGTSGADRFTSVGGDNFFNSFGGADIAIGGDGFDQIALTNSSGFGFNGSTNPTTGATINFLTGTITGGYTGTNITFSGFEVARGTNFADVFIGGNDDDAYYSFRGMGGADTYTGGTGANDRVDYSADAGAGGTAGVTVNLTTGTATDGFGNAETLTGIEDVRGTNQIDSLTGNGSDNSFNGMAGNDTLNGEDGDDTLNGGNGTDTLNGGSGSDWLSNYRDVYYDGATLGVVTNLATQTQTDAFGNSDTLSSIENVSGTQLADTLTGNSEDNRFRGYDGNDVISGGEGLDTVQAYGADTFLSFQDASTIHIRGTQGWNVNVLNGTVIDQFGNTDTISSIERFRGTMLADIFLGGVGSQYFRGLSGADSFDGDTGIDWVEYDDNVAFGATAGVTVNLLSGTASDGFGNTDTFVRIENIAGSGLNDAITGDAGANVLYGRAGADALDGGEGSDVVRGGTGADSLAGGSGNDLFYFSTSDLENGVIDTVTDGGASSADLIRIDGVAYYNVSVSNVNGTARVAVNFSGGTGYIDIAGIGSSPVVIATFQSQADVTALTSATRENLQITSFDWANSQGWTQYTELFSSAGQLERQFGTYDGTAGRWDFLWDPSNTNTTWTTRFDYFNAADQQTQQQGQYDSGGSWITTFDPGAAQVYDYYITYYNGSGQATQVQSFYDSGALSGGSGITTFDAANTQAYDNYTTYYDSLGRADTINGTYDGTNGTWWVDFDQANTQGWQSLTVLYDMAGVVTQQWYTMDNGSIVNL